MCLCLNWCWSSQKTGVSPPAFHMWHSFKDRTFFCGIRWLLWQVTDPYQDEISEGHVKSLLVSSAVLKGFSRNLSLNPVTRSECLMQPFVESTQHNKWTPNGLKPAVCTLKAAHLGWELHLDTLHPSRVLVLDHCWLNMTLTAGGTSQTEVSLSISDNYGCHDTRILNFNTVLVLKNDKMAKIKNVLVTQNSIIFSFFLIFINLHLLICRQSWEWYRST